MSRYVVHTKFVPESHLLFLHVEADRYNWPIQHVGQAATNVKFYDKDERIVLELDPEIVAAIELLKK